MLPRATLGRRISRCAAATGLASDMTKHFARMIFATIFALAGLLAAGASARAHPHVWVTMQGELVYAPDGSITGVRYAWTFDDMFSAFATQGLETKKPGVFTRQDLDP